MDRKLFEEEYSEEIEEVEVKMWLTAISIEKLYEALKQTNLPESIILEILCTKKNK